MGYYLLRQSTLVFDVHRHNAFTPLAPEPVFILKDVMTPEKPFKVGQLRLVFVLGETQMKNLVDNLVYQSDNYCAIQPQVQEGFEFMFGKEIGANEKYLNTDAYRYAKWVMHEYADQFGIRDDSITFQGDVNTFTFLMADLIEGYLDKYHRKAKE